MGVLTPLAAFQGLIIALAVGLVVDARKERKPLRYVLWALASGLAVLGVSADPISSKWPTALVTMEALGGSPVVWFVTLAFLYALFRPFWKTPEATTGIAAGPAYDPAALEAEILRIANQLADMAKPDNQLERRVTSAQNAVALLLERADRADVEIPQRFEDMVQKVTLSSNDLNDRLNILLGDVNRREIIVLQRLDVVASCLRALDLRFTVSEYLRKMRDMRPEQDGFSLSWPSMEMQLFHMYDSMVQSLKSMGGMAADSVNAMNAMDRSLLPAPNEGAVPPESIHSYRHYSANLQYIETVLDTAIKEQIPKIMAL